MDAGMLFGRKNPRQSLLCAAIMLNLHGRGNVDMEQLQEATGAETGDLERALDQLIDMGFITEPEDF
jgi:hypothetical protein